MSGEYNFNQSPEGENHERQPAEQLMAYLHGQFEDAYIKEYAGSEENLFATHGSFIKRVPLEMGHELTHNSLRIIMKPPHPYDTPGDYCEVFGLFQTGDQLADLSQDEPERYLLREYERGQPGPFWLIDNEGVYRADISEQDIEVLQGDYAPDQEEVQASHLLDRLYRYNIIASAE